ncbi:MAG: hypothetical protein IKO61_09540 [Lachnospiraceae bacterium]|nr:hypothetical protein [Lachnospiraceae bacterium]
MTQCPNCGGGVRFDAATQFVVCDYCSSQFDPYDQNFGNMAEAQEDMEITVFTCRNCGGEIASTQDTAAAFCSYCGSSTILEGRLSKEKKPEMIIPFKLTKEGCKDAFSSRLKRAIFAPTSYKKTAKADGFRGIYMPYWVYDMTQKGRMLVKSSSSHRSGDYIITDHYDLTGYIDNEYAGVSYDASSSFADDISEQIAPFNVKDIKYFTPSFLAGFYADIADVGPEVYKDTAVDLAKESTYNYLRKSSPMAGNSFEDSKDTVKKRIKTDVNAKHSAMFPVWFMSYRTKDRVAYATVNGQTGRVSADIPVSVPKYFAFSLALAAVLFGIFQLFLTLTPDFLMVSIAIVALVGAFMYNSEMKKILAKENYEDDLGMQDLFERRKKARVEAQDGASFDGVGSETYVLTQNDIKKNEQKAKKKEGKVIETLGGIAMVVFIMLFTFADDVFSVFSGINADKICGFVGLITFVISIFLTVSSQKKVSQMKAGKKLTGTLWTAIALFIITVVSFLDPPEDYIYYVCSMVAMAGVVVSIIDMMSSYNYIAMRPLPQFDTHTGGDDRA